MCPAIDSFRPSLNDFVINGSFLNLKLKFALKELIIKLFNPFAFFNLGNLGKINLEDSKIVIGFEVLLITGAVHFLYYKQTFKSRGN